MPRIGRSVRRLLKRADFLKCAQGRRWNTAALAVQMQTNGLEDFARIGFTVSRKNGNAVKRNRIRRRLKAAAAALPPDAMAAGHDYVIVARPNALIASFGGLQEQLRQAVAGVQRPPRTKNVERNPARGPRAAEKSADVET